MEETVKGNYQSHVILQLVTDCEENDNIKECTSQQEVQQLTNGDEDLVKHAGDDNIKHNFPPGVLPRNIE
jgi:hypothetical protein